MKKYQQLLLAVLSVVSFSCLLIYRHEYNKLRYVLEVLNFFGTPGGSTTPLQCQQEGSFTRMTQMPVDPMPAWQRISNSLYIYSAYWESVEKKEHVVAIAVGVLNENLSYGCYLYYNTIPKSKPGQFSFSGIPYKNMDNKIFGKSKTKGFIFYCESEDSKEVPVGVLFFKTSLNESSQGFLPVKHLQTNPPLPNTTAICLMPAPFSSFEKSNYLEFLSFHKLLGVKNYIVYGGNDQHKLLSSINENPSNEVNVTILPWNYPFFGDYDLMKIVAENDCKTRTIGVYETILILEWNKFFVPRYVLAVNEILNDLDSAKKIFKFLFSTLLFCSEYEDNMKTNKTTPYILRKTKFAFPKSDILVPAYRPFLRTGRSQKISRNIAAIQQYASCRDFKIKSGEKKVAKVDVSMYKFEVELLKSKLLKL